MSTCYSAHSRFLLRGAPDYSADTESEFHAEAHEQLQVKDLPRVPTRRHEVDSNPQPCGCKTPNIVTLHHRPLPPRWCMLVESVSLPDRYLDLLKFLVTASAVLRRCRPRNCRFYHHYQLLSNNIV